MFDQCLIELSRFYESIQNVNNIVIVVIVNGLFVYAFCTIKKQSEHYEWQNKLVWSVFLGGGNENKKGVEILCVL